jgi:hypothetical protein
LPPNGARPDVQPAGKQALKAGTAREPPIASGVKPSQSLQGNHIIQVRMFENQRRFVRLSCFGN